MHIQGFGTFYTLLIRDTRQEEVKFWLITIFLIPIKIK